MTLRLPFMPEEIEGSIATRWQKVAAHYPNELAVTTFEGEQYTYLELELASNRIANAILQECGPENHPILLLLEHSYELLVGIWGVIKANKAYVVLNPTEAKGPMQRITEQTAAPLIITAEPLWELAQAVAPSAAVWSMDTLPTSSEQPPDVTTTGETTVAIIFTSGTTKRPKGVAYSHRMIMYQVWFEDSLYQFGPGQRFSGMRSCGVGGGVPDLFTSLLTGSAYALYQIQKHGLQSISSWLQTERITYFHPPIILFRQWLETLTPTDFFPDLRQVRPSGRKVKADLTHLWPHVADECMVLTSYGTTETAFISQRAIDRRMPVPDGLLDVGEPLPSKRIIVVDSAREPVATGEAGEVVVCSRHIATGYWQQPNLTAEHFTSATDGSEEMAFYTGDWGRLRNDGCLELLGRQDSQVKLRGYRIVLGDIEDALRVLPNIQEAVVTADEERGLLHAYLVATAEPPPSLATIRTGLAKSLPTYALPTHLSYLPSFPLLSSGKINRQALPPPVESRPALETSYAPPQTDTQAALILLWKELLQLEEIGIHDNFFDLGGHSILGMRLMVEVEREFKKQLENQHEHQLENRFSAQNFFHQPTIAHLAQMLDGERSLGASSESITKDFQARLADRLSPVQIAAVKEIYNQLGQPEGKQSWRKDERHRWPRQRKAIHYASRLLPSIVAKQTLAQLVAIPALRRHFFARKEALIHQFLQQIDTPHRDEKTVSAALFYGALQHYHIGRNHIGRNHIGRNHRREPGSDRCPNQRIQITGGEFLRHSKKTNHSEEDYGTILLRSHETTQDYFHLLGLDSYRVGQIQNHIIDFQIDDEVVENSLYTHHLNTARQVLLSGGKIDISADGIQGYSSGMEVNFLGRRRQFWTSFAELAIITGAQVFVVKTSAPKVQLCNGQPTLEFVGPLHIGDKTLSPKERVERLVAQYVSLLGEMWTESPWLVPWYQMERHLGYPPSNDSETNDVSGEADKFIR